jgi:hypothetical protein
MQSEWYRCARQATWCVGTQVGTPGHPLPEWMQGDGVVWWGRAAMLGRMVSVMASPRCLDVGGDVGADGICHVWLMLAAMLAQMVSGAGAALGQQTLRRCNRYVERRLRHGRTARS